MITVFTPSFADENNTNAQNLTVKEVVSRLDPARFRVVLLGAGAPDPRIAARPNTRILPWRRHGNTARVLLYLLTQPPDVYFFPREGPLDSAFLTARKKLGLKTALVTYVISGGLLGAERPLLFRAIREADVVAGNSRHMTRTAEQLGGKNVETVYDGVDRRYFHPRCSVREDPVAVLFAGSFRSYKRADLVIREAAKYPGWKFRLAGTGEEEGACRRLAADTGCGNVEFLGHQMPAQLGDEMRRADIFFFPSEIEGHPQVLLQAAACGLPCVARASYQPDYVVDDVTGFLANWNEELSAALGRLIAQEDLRRQMSLAAAKHAEQFDWERIAGQWEELMECAIANRKNSARGLCFLSCLSRRQVIVRVRRRNLLSLFHERAGESRGRLFRERGNEVSADSNMPGAGELKLNIGCGTSGAAGWVNIDNSPSIVLSRLPFGRRIFHTPDWPSDVRRADVRKRIPYPDSSVSCIYSSHTFEHFTYEESRSVARECFRVLRPGGILRIVVPDLEILVHDYLAAHADPLASHKFVSRLLLMASVREIVHSGAHHKQMFDARSLSHLLQEAGFRAPERRSFGDSRIAEIQEIELESRWSESLYVEALR